jgi:serine/threonine-protein kinase
MIINKNGDNYFIKLLDFGIAITSYASRLTKTGNFMGSENYVSPEQIKENKSVAPSLKSDIFSLGIVFNELLTMKKPEDITYRIMNNLAIDDFFSTDANLPESLLDLIKAMLQKYPAKRPDSQTVLQKLTEIYTATV